MIEPNLDLDALYGGGRIPVYIPVGCYVGQIVWFGVGRPMVFGGCVRTIEVAPAESLWTPVSLWPFYVLFYG